MVDLNRCVATIAIVVAGACTTAMNWRFSYQLGTAEWDSYTWAIFSVALDVSKWLMLPFTDLPPDKVHVILSVFLAITCEVISALGFFAIMPSAPARQSRSATPATSWKPPAWPVTWLRRKANGAVPHTVSRPAKT